MPKPEQLRGVLQKNLDGVLKLVNGALAGNGVSKLEPVLARIGRGQQLPHWYKGLKTKHVLPNLDGKTIGSVVEMLLVAVLETYTFQGMGVPPLRINPAKGIDLPDLDLGVKSPSENFCTSEPYFSAYERLIGSDHDCLVLLTDYQTAKNTPPLRLQIINSHYLTKSQIADKNLCTLAKAHRGWLVKEDPARAQRFVRFLAYVNQSDWRAKRLLRLAVELKPAGLMNATMINAIMSTVEMEFIKMNKKRMKQDKIPIPDEDIQALRAAMNVVPPHIGIIDAMDNWVVETFKDAARAPNDDEWKRFLASPLDGMIGMSLALQWRYNFGPLFGVEEVE